MTTPLVFEESDKLSARTEIVDNLFASDFLRRISSGGQMVMRSTERRRGGGGKESVATNQLGPRDRNKENAKTKKTLKGSVERRM